MPLTKDQEAVLVMLETNTHAFWSPKDAIDYTKAFGFECKVKTYKANTGDPKGLTLKDGSNSADGASSWDISGQIINHLGLQRAGMMGRGFQVRADVSVIRQHFDKVETGG